MKVDKTKWETKPISSFFDLQMGKTPSRKSLELWENGDMPWVSIADMKGKRNISATNEMLPMSTIKQCNIPIVPVGTVIMSFKLTIGKTCIVGTPLTTNEAIMSFLPKKGVTIDNSFLSYSLSAIRWKGNRAVKGITINKKIISQKEISIPPLHIQQSIAKELDLVQAMIDGYRQQIADLDTLEQSIFNDTFGDFIANKKEWKKKRLKDICIINPSKKEASYLNENDLVSFLPMEDLAVNSYKFTPVHNKTYGEVIKSSYTYFSVNDVLIAKVTPCFENGKAGVPVKLSNKVGFGTSELIVFRPKGEVISDYLYYCLTTPYFKKLGHNHLTGVSGLRRLDKNFIANYKISLPPMKLQHQFATRIDKIEQQKEAYKQQLQDAETLMEERMQYYFS